VYNISKLYEYWSLQSKFKENILFFKNKEKLKILDFKSKKYEHIFNIKKKIMNKNIWGLINFILKNKINLNYTGLSYDDIMNNKTYEETLKIIKEEWNDIKWIISFKFDTVFTQDHRDILLLNIKDYINDQELMSLLKFILKKEITEIDYIKSVSWLNISKCNRLYHLLINIFFIQLDKKMKEIKLNFFEKESNFACLNYLNFISLKLSKKLCGSEYLSVLSELDTEYLELTKDNIRFIRYLDSFIIGVKSNEIQAIEIKKEVDLFLKSKLLLNNVYSYITNIRNDNLKFLDVIITSGLCSNSISQVNIRSLSFQNKDKKFDNKYNIVILTPRYLIIRALINTGILNKKGKPVFMKKLLNFDVNVIISTYLNIHNFILYSFFSCDDFLNLSKLIFYYIYTSLKFTLQIKLNSKINDINILLRLGLINNNIFRNFYFFKTNNTKYLRKNCRANNYFYALYKVNWESKVNLDFLGLTYITLCKDSVLLNITKNEFFTFFPKYLDKYPNDYNFYSFLIFTKKLLLNCKIKVVIINRKVFKPFSRLIVKKG
jgi:hypothetical protein